MTLDDESHSANSDTAESADDLCSTGQLVRSIIAAMPSRFDAEAAGSLCAVIQFRLSGSGGGEWYADIAEGRCALVEGASDQPDITLRMKAATYVDMVMGRITGQHAFFTRKLTYSGDIALAIRLHRLFRAPDDAELAALGANEA